MLWFNSIKYRKLIYLIIKAEGSLEIGFLVGTPGVEFALW
jgi:hypothetical protein